MSATNRGATRHENDHYPTTPELARFLVQHLRDDYFPENPPVNVLDPGCGEGAFLDACHESFPWTTVLEGEELDQALAQETMEKGFRVRNVDTLELEHRGDYHLIVGNPPFKHAESFLQTLVPCLDPQHGVLAFLLRLNYLATQGRYERLWQDVRPHRVLVLPARPGFIRTGPKAGETDAAEYMLCTFKRRHSGPTITEWLDNRHVENTWPKQPEKPEATPELEVFA